MNFILNYKTEADRKLIKGLLDSLGYEGIGGKRSVGYGKFKCTESSLFKYDNMKINKYLLLSNLCIDNNADIESTKKDCCYYNIIPVNGYVNFRGNAPYKRKLTNMIEAGAVFNKEIDGSIKNVANNKENQKEKVWLYGKGLYIGI
jgi:CRISPR-associated protein Csm4